MYKSQEAAAKKGGGHSSTQHPATVALLLSCLALDENEGRNRANTSWLGVKKNMEKNMFAFVITTIKYNV